MIHSELLKALETYFENNLEKWQQYCQLITTSKFLMGQVTDFQICLKWAIRADKIENIMSGAYRCGVSNQTQTIDSEQVPIFNTANISGLMQEDLIRVQQKQVLTFEQIQDSVYQFAHDYRKSLKSKVKDPISYLMSILLKGKIYETQATSYKSPETRVGEMDAIISEELDQTQEIAQTLTQYKQLADKLEIKDIALCKILDVVSESKPVSSAIYQELLDDHDIEHFEQMIQEKFDLSVQLKSSAMDSQMLQRSLHGILHDMQHLSKEEGRGLILSAVNNLTFSVPYISYTYRSESYAYAQEVLAEIETLLFNKYGDIVFSYLDHHYNLWKENLPKSELDIIINQIPGCGRLGSSAILGERKLKEYFRKEIMFNA